MHPPEQIAATAQNVLRDFFRGYILSPDYSKNDGIKVAMRPFDWRYPTPELEGTHSCILYFETQADMDEFEAMVHQAKPNMKVQQL